MQILKVLLVVFLVINITTGFFFKKKKKVYVHHPPAVQQPQYPYGYAYNYYYQPAPYYYYQPTSVYTAQVPATYPEPVHTVAPVAYQAGSYAGSSHQQPLPAYQAASYAGSSHQQPLPAYPAASYYGSSHQQASAVSQAASFAGSSHQQASAVSQAASFAGSSTQQALPAFEAVSFNGNSNQQALPAFGSIRLNSNSNQHALPAVDSNGNSRNVEVVPSVGFRMGTVTNVIEVLKSEGRHIELPAEIVPVNDAAPLPVFSAQNQGRTANTETLSSRIQESDPLLGTVVEEVQQPITVSEDSQDDTAEVIQELPPSVSGGANLIVLPDSAGDNVELPVRIEETAGLPADNAGTILVSVNNDQTVTLPETDDQTVGLGDASLVAVDLPEANDQSLGPVAGGQTVSFAGASVFNVGSAVDVDQTGDLAVNVGGTEGLSLDGDQTLNVPVDDVQTVGLRIGDDTDLSTAGGDSKPATVNTRDGSSDESGKANAQPELSSVAIVPNRLSDNVVTYQLQSPDVEPLSFPEVQQVLQKLLQRDNFEEKRLKKDVTSSGGYKTSKGVQIDPQVSYSRVARQ
ncbi:uncharacterized protein LOC121595293 [Anopheles merus]|uniref:uncharacterized protein LOC121595293 n=1 Tax=Anopheles merus TaxID=30066 RepID=UPI001BE3E969|nr:uncharacterized protein LOC121595293 [Anopheles merus]